MTNPDRDPGARHPLDIWRELPVPGPGDAPLPEPPLPAEPAEPAGPREASARDIAAALGVTAAAIRARARRQGWPHRRGPGKGNEKIFDVSRLPQEIRERVRKSRPRRRAAAGTGPGLDNGIRIPPRKRRQFLDLGEAAR